MKKLLIALFCVMTFGCVSAQGGGSTSDTVRGNGTTTIATVVQVTNNVITVVHDVQTNFYFNASAPTDPPWQYGTPFSGTNWMEISTSSNVNLLAWTTKTQGTGNQPNVFNFTDANGKGAVLPALSKLKGYWGGVQYSPSGIDFKRRVVKSKEQTWDFVEEAVVALQFTNVIPDGATVVVSNADGTVFANLSYPFSAVASTNRWNRNIHITQLGFHPLQRKEFFVSEYRGTNLMETAFTNDTFYVYDVAGGTNITSGTLSKSQDLGSNYSVPAEQGVWQGVITGLTLPGTYRIRLPWGVSTDFINDFDIYHNTLKTALLGEYVQRCGTPGVTNPFSAWIHGPCHWSNNTYAVTTNQADSHITGDIRSAAATTNNTVFNKLMMMTNVLASWYPESKWQDIAYRDTVGGHHDAGDYSKYIHNTGMTVIYNTMAVDVGQNHSDDLGIPESGDGVPDGLNEAKWDGDFIVKFQDTDGGIGFLEYPKSGTTYENNSPDIYIQHQRYPKTTISTAAGGAALAYLGSSPTFKALYPATATVYTNAAVQAFNWCTNMFAQHGGSNSCDFAYAYGELNGHADEFAALCISLFGATKNTNYLVQAKAWMPSMTSSTFKHFTWVDDFEYAGPAIEGLATFVQSGRGTTNDLGAYYSYWQDATNQVHTAAVRQITLSTNQAYRLSYPPEAKRSSTSPYQFSGCDQVTTAVDTMLQRFHAGVTDTNNINVMIAGINWAYGGNPVNKSRIYDFGQNTPKISIHQWGRFTNKQELGPPGWIVGDAVDSATGNYKTDIQESFWPPIVTTGNNNASLGEDQGYPLMQRMDDYTCYSVAETTIEKQAKTFFRNAVLDVVTRTNTVPAPYISFSTSLQQNVPVTATLVAPGVDLSTARTIWWVSGDKQYITRQLTKTPTSTSTNWTVTATLKDGRVYGVNLITTVAP